MKRKYILVYAFIASLVLGIIGFTYAWFSMKIIGNENAKNIIVKANGLNLVYTDTTPLILNQIVPGDTITKVFKVKNESNNTMNYQMKWKDLINTFKAGELRISLTCISKDENDNVSGTCESIEDKMVPYTETQRSDYVIKNNIEINSKITHEYTMTIEFIEKTINQSYNKNKTFNGKIIIENATAVNNCIFDGELVQGAEYVNGQYTYRYKQERGDTSWQNINADGWGVILTDKNSTGPVTTPLCTSINGKPIVSMSGMFGGSKATTIDLSSFDTSNVTNMRLMFYGSQATELDLSSFDTSNVTNMSYMFWGSKMSTIDLSSFDTSNVTNMQSMFAESQATTIDLSSFDISKVTNMYRMFYNSQATSIDLSSFDTSNVTDMQSMFSGSQATTLDLSSFDTSNVTTMSVMFYQSKATTINLSSFDTSNVTNMYGMFEYSEATTLDLSSFDTSNVTNMQGMFEESQATTIYVSDKWDTSLVTYSDNMFYNASDLKGGAGTTYNSSNPTDKTYAHIDGGVSNPGYFTDKDQIEEETSVPTRPVNNCTYNGSLIQGAEYTNGQYTYRYMQEGTSPSWQNINADGWGVKLTDKDSTDAVTTPLCTSINGKPIVSMSAMFILSQATSIDVSSFDTSNVTNMLQMFYGSQATTLDLSGFDTRNVTNTHQMFFSSQATSIDVSSFDTSNVTNMGWMFNRSEATELDLSSFDTSKVTNMESMFLKSKATSIDLSSFDTSKVTDMGGMFYGSQATTIYVSDNWTTNNIIETSYSGSLQMFKDALNIVGGQGTTYNSSNPTDKTYAHVDGGVSNPGYFTYKSN